MAKAYTIKTHLPIYLSLKAEPFITTPKTKRARYSCRALALIYTEAIAKYLYAASAQT
ncbi:hypothetical protein GCM10023092_02120 [Rurimicrobium arvi]|uniref:Uncharacterized protein n=1 Tax=Rurimicrobium arvi TaxID=2049916 RepID=A0ABP8MG14_9BACT